MHSRLFRHLLEAVVFLGTLSRIEWAVSATATAVVSVTILASNPPPDSLMLSSLDLNMRGKMSDEITVSNRSDAWKEIRITLTPQSADLAGCQLHYSPMSASIPPGGAQVVRLLMTTNHNTDQCSMEHRLVIADARDPLSPLFDVPVYTGQF